MIKREPATNIINKLIKDIIFQILEYKKYDYEIKGIVGINRSPSCGVETTSANNKEIEGEGVFIKALRNELKRNNIQLKFVGIKAFETDKVIEAIEDLIGNN
jgi:predicted secreted protein